MSGFGGVGPDELQVMRPGRDIDMIRTPRFATIVLAGWALVALVLLLTSADAIHERRFPDADDDMRLLQVRDWLAGQGWFDVAQHRLNRGDFPMHWSRLVDLPLAGTMLLLRPMVGGATAELVAIVAVPLLTLLAVVALAAAITRRVAGTACVPAAVVLVALSSPLLFQLRPLRIDHHGWQIVLALVAVWALIGRPTARGGMVAGLALATLLTVSLEGLPIAAAVAGVAAIGWALQPWRGAFLRALAWTFAAAALALHAATRGPGFWTQACDAMAPAWLAVLGVAAVGVTLAGAVGRFGVAARLAALAVTGTVALATLRALSPACLAGPFATLPPQVYRIWYLSVFEGRPLWDQTPAWAMMTIGLPLTGIVGGAIFRQRSSGATRKRWSILLAVLVVATVVAVFVNRAGSTANALAVPGGAALLTGLMVRAREIPQAGRRILATLGAILLASPGMVAALALVAIPARGTTPTVAYRPSCRSATDMRVLRALPPGIVFAPIDMTPALLVDTGHRAVAGGYHRGAAAMQRVLTGFMARPMQAQAAILASGADYLVACPGMSELALYRGVAPGGLWARLERGERFEWLRPLPVRGPALAWQVIHPLPRSAPAH